jgi:hypothetical protein
VVPSYSGLFSKEITIKERDMTRIEKTKKGVELSGLFSDEE